MQNRGLTHHSFIHSPVQCSITKQNHCLKCFSILQVGKEKEELSENIMTEMDNLLSEAWLTGNEDTYTRIFHLIAAENVSGKGETDRIM